MPPPVLLVRNELNVNFYVRNIFAVICKRRNNTLQLQVITSQPTSTGPSDRHTAPSSYFLRFWYNNLMKTKKILILALLVLGFSSKSFAAVDDDDDSAMSFDSIVKDLSSSRSSLAPSDSGTDPFDLVLIHFGIGFVSSYISYEANQGPVSGMQQGFQAALGIDLFSRNWQAEGTVRSFSETQVKDTRASLHEFDLKIQYTFISYSSLEPYLGLGVAARYLDVNEAGKISKYTTPASIMTLGSSLKISDSISLAGEMSYRRPLIDETAERSAVDMALRLNTNF